MKNESPAFHRNLLIIANAGSGKTHCLVTRCIQLLRRGAKPEEILALTFTRAAAAEFLQKLFERLSQSAANPKELESLQGELGEDSKPITAEGCTQLLRVLVQTLPRLSMGTLDQYFGRIVRAFPFELGLSKEVELLNDADKEENQRRTLDRLFADAAKEKGLDEFIETLRQQSRNRSDQSALNAISRAAASLQEKFIETPKNRPWGDSHAIWPNGLAILDAEDVVTAADKFCDEVFATNRHLDDQSRATFGEWLKAAKEHRPPKRMSKLLDTFVKKLTDKGLGKGRATEEYIPIGKGKSKQIFLRGRVRILRDNLYHSILKLELQGKMRSSAALYDLLGRYEEIYEKSVRMAGQLTFTDLATLLATHQKNIDHKHIEYRLDSRYRHWLLDEFQDTSRLQWRIMEPLADEVVCGGDDRSFFYVGDAKQAIYGWRGGDFKLFEQVYDNFRLKRGVGIARRQLPDSWRSDGNIVKVINEVFAPDRMEGTDDFPFPEETKTNWRKAWVVHSPREERLGKGFAQLQTLKADQDEGDDAPSKALDEGVLRIIREVDPVGRGITCAILVRTRKKLDHYVALLRGQENPIPVAAEGRVNPCLKSPEGMALLALVKFLASPIDQIAEKQFLASPLKFLTDDDPAAFHGKALGLIAESGWAITLSTWVRRAVRIGALDSGKMEAFIEAAFEYEAQKKPVEELRAFAEFIEHRVEQESETPGVVRVMTIHSSKGLGMDMVILPELDGKGMAEMQGRSPISVHRNHDGSIEWGMSLPSKDICEADEKLRGALEHLSAQQAYENLCVLYVAMTRAKHALYCLRAPGRNNKNAGRWLANHFPGEGQDADNKTLGDPKWFASFHPQNLEPPQIEGTVIRRSSPTMVGRAPSSHEGEDIPTGLILGGGAARQLGTEVHELLAQVEWLGDEPDYAGASEEAANLVSEFLASDRAAVLKKPGWPCMSWRERAFDVEIEGRSVSGIFDRVHIKLGEGGKPEEAHVYDYKTDRDTTHLRARYQGQLDMYAKAAARLLDIPIDKIETCPIAVRCALAENE